MSGGAFDYQEWHISNIADGIENELERQGKPKPKEELWASEDYYTRNPDELTWYTYPEEVQKEMRKGVEILRQAYVYAKRIDYLLSGDDGEEKFLEKLKQELRALK